MKLTYKPLINPSKEEMDLLQNWRNDPKIKHLFSVHKNEDDLNTAINLKRLNDEYTRHKDTYRYLISLRNQPIGEINYQCNPKHLIKSQENTAWVGIVIGESFARAKGVGTQAMKYLEEQIMSQKFDRIELGVFEFNQPALNLYLKSGYKEIGRIPKLTYWKGRLWDSIHLEKKLV
ncbi:MAG: GNAT family N-acetyltransferase [Marinicellaceae bacterium]